MSKNKDWKKESRGKVNKVIRKGNYKDPNFKGWHLDGEPLKVLLEAKRMLETEDTEAAASG